MKEYNCKESEFAASIAAAAYAIYSLEETRAEFEKRMVESFREDPNTPKTKTRYMEDNNSQDDDNTFEQLPNLGNLMRQLSHKETRDGGN